MAINPLSFDSSNPVSSFTLPNDFGKVVRLFPLPNLVLFPGVVQTLHIFEPRYRQMIHDALQSDQLISMALENVENVSQGDPRPDLLSTVCVGKIVSHNEFEDGRYNLLLVGCARAKITKEIVTDHPYRTAEVEVLEDSLRYAPDDADPLRQQVLGLFKKLIDQRGISDVESLSRLFEGDVPLGQLTDLICFACGAETIQQQRVLEETEICRRAEVLIQILQGLLSKSVGSNDSENGFPPEFSDN